MSCTMQVDHGSFSQPTELSRIILENVALFAIGSLAEQKRSRVKIRSQSFTTLQLGFSVH